MTATDLLHQICAVPTSPFSEHRVIEWVLRWAKSRRRLKVRRDRDGNVLLELPGQSPGPRTVMVAHLDHPGFTAIEMLATRTLRARFNGGVQAKYFAGERVRFFDDVHGEVRGTIVDVETTEGRPTGATLRVPKPVAPGTIGMWDQGGPRTKGGKFYCRVCDDLAGAASALAAIDKLYRAKLATPVAVLLTRGEEEAFIGAIAAVRNKQLLRPTDLIISIECSAEQPYARQGDGVVLRAGDRTSIFNSAYTRFMQNRAEAMAKADKSFKWQRALMPGGTCEATVFDAWNFFAAAVCVPLGNYHNQNVAAGKIGPEYVHLQDWQNMVALLADVARHAYQFTGDHAELRDRLTKRFASFAPLLKSPLAQRV